MDNTEEDLIRPIFENGRYQNPFDTYEDTLGQGPLMLKLTRSEDHSNIPNQRVRSIKKQTKLQIYSLQEQNTNFSTGILQECHF